MDHNSGKGKRKAENQRKFREKKKENDQTWLEKEAKRVKKYYVPISQMTEPEKAARRKKVREAMRKSRAKKKIASEIAEENGNRASCSAEEPSCSTHADVSAK